MSKQGKVLEQVVKGKRRFAKVINNGDGAILWRSRSSAAYGKAIEMEGEDFSCIEDFIKFVEDGGGMI